MKQGASRLRRVPESAEALAEMPARALPDQAVAARAIAIDLRPVISAYRKRGRFQLRVEKLPQGGRFSAGQNNGDGSWSLLLDELEDLVYFAPKTAGGDHVLAIRLIAKDETEAFTIALIDFTVRMGETSAPGGPASALPDAVRDEVHRLKATLEARETELTQLRESAERMGVMLQQKLDSAVAEARAQWKRDEEARLDAEKLRLEEGFGHRIAEQEMRAKALADIQREQQEAAIRLGRQELAAARDALAARESELTAARAQMERLRQDWEAEIQSIRTAGDAKTASLLAAAKAESEKFAADIAARRDAELRDACKAADARLAEAVKEAEAAAAQKLAAAQADWAAKQASRSSQPDPAAEAELVSLRGELERMREDARANLAATQAAADARNAAALQAAEAEWKAQLEKALAELAAAREAAPAGGDLRGESERKRLQAEIIRLREEAQADLAVADAQAADALKAAEGEWQARSERAMAALRGRCEAAEAALAAADGPAADREAEIRHLQTQFDHLQKSSEAEIAALRLAAEMRAEEARKAAEADWQARLESGLAQARREASEAALADRGERSEKRLAERDAQIAQLRIEIDRQVKAAEADMAAARAASDVAAGEKLKAAHAIWERETAGALGDAHARAEKAESALALEQQAAAGRSHDDEYVHSLEREIKTLRATLVDREAAIVQAQAMQEHQRLGTVREGPGARWQPLSTRAGESEAPRAAKPAVNTRLLRDIGVVAAFAAGAVLLLPKLEGMLPNSVRWQIETLGGLYMPETLVGPAAPVPVAAVTPRAEAVVPRLYAARSVNVRAAPSTGAAVIANLKRGASVGVLETKGAWSRVELSGRQQGWAFNTYLVETDPGVAAKPAP
jgi:hypothetical protein